MATIATPAPAPVGQNGQAGRGTQKKDRQEFLPSCPENKGAGQRRGCPSRIGQPMGGVILPGEAKGRGRAAP